MFKEGCIQSQYSTSLYFAFDQAHRSQKYPTQKDIR